MIFEAQRARFYFAMAAAILMGATFVAIAGLMTPASAQGVSIHPKRVIIEERERSTTIELINRGNEGITYRLGFQQVRMNDDGEREIVEEARPGELFSDEMIRFSPRQVALRPGETQRVRLMVRKPADLAPGEYRSHLLFQALPTTAELPAQSSDESAGQGEGLSISLQMRTNLSIPVIVRHGELDADVEVSDVEFDEESESAVSFSLQRNGKRSVYGDFQASFVVDESDEEIDLAIRRGVAVYAPNERRNFRFPLQLPEGISPQDGKLRIRFSEQGRQGVETEWSGAIRIGNDDS